MTEDFKKGMMQLLEIDYLDSQIIKLKNDRKKLKKQFSLQGVGEQLLCLDNECFEYNLTKGKKYKLIKKDKKHYYVINDLGHKFGFKKERFKKL